MLKRLRSCPVVPEIMFDWDSYNEAISIYYSCLMKAHFSWTLLFYFFEAQSTVFNNIQNCIE